MRCLRFCILVFLFCTHIYAQQGKNNPFTLTFDDMAQITSLAGADLLESSFTKDSKTKKVLMISDFNNLSDFDIDIGLLARELISDMVRSQKFALTAAISGNAFNADPSLDKIRAMRNNEEFADIIPKGTLIAPKYSLSARITNDTTKQGSLHIVSYHFIFSIVNLESGLVEWDYIEHIKKASKEPLPALDRESLYGKKCLATSLGAKERKEACEVAISEIWLGIFESIPQNKKPLLHSYALKACELDSPFGCRALGASYKFEKKDLNNAKKYYEKACDSKDGGGCYNLSIMYEHAQGIPQNIPLAKKYATLSCDYGFKAGCENLKALEQYSENENLDKYGLMYKSDCENGLGTACERLSSYYYHGFGGANKNHTQARILLEKGCELKDANSCYQLGLWEMQGLGGTTKDANKALEHTLFACESDVKRNCKAVSALSEEKANIYRCEEHTKIIINVACSGAASIYEHGFGSVSSNNELALKYYQKACKGGLDNACSMFNSLQQKLK